MGRRGSLWKLPEEPGSRGSRFGISSEPVNKGWISPTALGEGEQGGSFSLCQQEKGARGGFYGFLCEQWNSSCCSVPALCAGGDAVRLRGHGGIPNSSSRLALLLFGLSLFSLGLGRRILLVQILMDLEMFE